MTTTTTVAEHVPTWSLGDRLRKARRDARIPTSTMADKLSCHRNSVLAWETDKSVPPLGVVVRWAKFTHVPLAWFVQDIDGDPASTIWYWDDVSDIGLSKVA